MIKTNKQTFLSVKNEFEQPLTRVVESLLISFILFIAISTMLLMVGLYFELKFSVIAPLILLLPILIIIVSIFMIIKLFMKGKWKRTEIHLLVGIVLISLCGTFLSVSINRPDIDDSIYVPKAVFYAENPDVVIDKSVSWIVSPDKIPVSGLLQYYEISQAAFASILEIKYLDLYHIIFPGIVGFFICLSMFLLLRIFGHRKSGLLLSILFLLLILMVLGETHRTIGNLSFARAFHGKFMFLFVGMPSWVYFSLRYFLMRDLFSWMVLLALGIGMAGVTTTAMVILPLLSVVIITSYIVNESKTSFSLSYARLTLTYFSALIPLVLMALNFRSFAINHLQAGKGIHSGFPGSFSEQMQLLINPEYPLTPVTFLLATLLVIIFSGYRKFFLVWIAIILIFLLNPFVSNFVIENITTENIYWRLFYLLPFPLVVCIAFSILINGQRVSRSFALLLLALLIPLAFLGPTSVLRSENGSTFEILSYKIGTQDLSASREIINRTTSGSMMAPLELSSQILILSSQYPQIHTRSGYLRLMLSSIGHIDEYNNRVKAYDYLYKEVRSAENKLSFLKIIRSKIKPDYVIVRNNSIRIDEVVDILVQEKYERSFIADDRYTVFQHL